MKEKQPHTLDDVKQDGDLYRKVEDAYLGYSWQVLPLNEEERNASRNLDSAIRRIGLAIVEGKEPDDADVLYGRELCETIQHVQLQRNMIRDQARGAICEELKKILSSETVETIPEEKMISFCSDIERQCDAQLSLGRAVYLVTKSQKNKRDDNSG